MLILVDSLLYDGFVDLKLNSTIITLILSYVIVYLATFDVLILWVVTIRSSF